jgi:type 1 glutamine amidotransferase
MRRLLPIFLLCALLGGCATTAAPDRVLVFTRTEGWRHDSIPAAVAALQRLGAQENLHVDATEDAAAFSADNLGRYRAVVFASTTLDVLDDTQQGALQDFIRGGGGFMGVHAAADTEYDWDWYGELVGAWFHSHPPGLQASDVRFEIPGVLPADGHWRVTDELYNFRRNPRGRVQVIATVDEAHYAGGTMGDDHPIAWCRAFDGGRSWYTGLGHDAALYGDEVFLRHLRRGLRYAAARAPEC